jgi:hypothetical protein
VKLYQINADDLTALEELLPEFCCMLGEKLNDTAIRMKFRRAKEILANVRWDYGPPSEVQVMPTDDPDDPTKQADWWKDNT